MDHSTDKIHVMPDEGQWDVEDQEGNLLAHANDRAQAVEDAKRLGRERGLQAVIIHDGDGVTEEVPL